jgi:hypothetical protein
MWEKAFFWLVEVQNPVPERNIDSVRVPRGAGSYPARRPAVLIEVGDTPKALLGIRHG